MSSRGRHGKPTALITGCSTGIGRATALELARRGWNVAATMRSPERADEALRGRPMIEVLPLDVTDQASMDAGVAATMERFGRIDTLVDNAGYGLTAPVELLTDEQIARQVDTNFIGVVKMCRAVIPHLRAGGGGTIVNVTSVAGRMGVPLYGMYCATKFAVEGLSEAMAFELAPHGIRVKIVEPGPVKTDFTGRSMDNVDAGDEDVYADYIHEVRGRMHTNAIGATPQRVARVIARAAASRTPRLRYVPDAIGVVGVIGRQLLPTPLLAPMVRRSTGG